MKEDFSIQSEEDEASDVGRIFDKEDEEEDVVEEIGASECIER